MQFIFSSSLLDFKPKTTLHDESSPWYVLGNFIFIAPPSGILFIVLNLIV